MPERKAIRFLGVSLALLALLLFAGSFGGVRHHHAGSSNADCSNCHLNHESMERSPIGHRTPVLVAVAARLEPQQPRFTRNFELPPLPARAPPSA
jgi:hypothetical protein